MRLRSVSRAYGRRVSRHYVTLVTQSRTTQQSFRPAGENARPHSGSRDPAASGPSPNNSGANAWTPVEGKSISLLEGALREATAPAAGADQSDASSPKRRIGRYPTHG